jgi:hypothetical protein
MYRDSFTDYAERIVEVEWTEELWDKHLNKHSELVDHKTASLLIKNAVEDPSIVMEGVRPGGKEQTTIYYKELKLHQHFVTFTKVVCLTLGKLRVKTVFNETSPMGNVVRERGYPSFKEIWRTKTNIY